MNDTQAANSIAKPKRQLAGSKKNHALIMVWILIWMASFVAMDKAAENNWFGSQNMTLAGIVINILLGVGVVVTYMKFLEELDELQRKIQLTALALGMGVGLVGSVCYALLLASGQVSRPDIGVVIMLLSGGYMAGIIVGRARYS